jgi:Mg2+/Co2+ transporter CorB
MTYVVLIVLLLLLSFFSASETALTFVSKAKLHQMAKGGDSKAKVILELQDKLGLVIGVILTCATLLSAIIVSIGTDWIAQFQNPYLTTFSPIIMATIILLYAEVMPKMAVLENTTRFLCAIAPVLFLLFRLFHPFNIVLQHISRLTLKLFRIQAHWDGPHGAKDKDELRGVIDLHHGSDQDTVEEKAMLKSILDLGSVPLSAVMTHRQNVVMVDLDLPTQTAIDLILESPFTRIPIWSQNPDNIVGVLHARALLRTIRTTPDHNVNLSAVASEPWFVPESTDLLDQLQAFRQRREHFAIVVDEYGSVLGIVTLEDILEEIVGDIMDEHDILVGGIRTQDDGSYLVQGQVTIRDLNRQFDWALPDEKAATVAGLLLHQFRMIPQVGQIFHLERFRFEVLRKQGNQIVLVRITVEKTPEIS